jgi:hypothetical protein
MMHTTKIRTPRGAVHFHHDGDFGGDIWISGEGLQIENDHVVLPAEAIEGFFAERRRSRRISKIEQASTEELLRDA